MPANILPALLYHYLCYPPVVTFDGIIISSNNRPRLFYLIGKIKNFLIFLFFAGQTILVYVHQKGRGAQVQDEFGDIRTVDE